MKQDKKCDGCGLIKPCFSCVPDSDIDYGVEVEYFCTQCLNELW